MTTATSTKSALTINDLTIRLTQDIAQLHESIGKVELTLHPILRLSLDKTDTTDTPDTQADTAEPSLDSSLFCQLAVLVDEVELANSKVLDLGSRSQLG